MVNFRTVKLGGIAEGVLYRSEHPAYLGDEDKAVVKLAKRAGIHCVINLNDNDRDLRFAAEGSSWYAGLVQRGAAGAFKMKFDFCAFDFKRKLRKALLFMLANDGPYLVHCYAGVDRTGIVCAILAALMGASPEEIAADYARSFYNGAESSVYAGDVSAAGGAILRQLDAVFGVETHDGIVLASLAECYLKEKLRMIGAQIAALKARLAGKKMNELRKFFTGLSLYDKPPMIY